MQYLQIALNRVKNMRNPATNSRSGLIVYEPDSNDRTPEAAFKRRIFQMAYMAEGIADCVLAGQPPIAVAPKFDSKIFNDIPEKISAEADEFRICHSHRTVTRRNRTGW